MKEIQTNGITILFVEVPEDAREFKIENGLLLFKVDFIPFGIVIPPQGLYQILGKSTEPIHELLGISKEEYLSLLEANGIVDRNMIDKPNESDILEDCEDWVYARAKYQSLLEQWLEAQSKVKHYLVLKRI